MRRAIAVLAGLLMSGSAIAQTTPNWALHYVPPPAEWNALWASKQDYNAPGVFTTLATVGNATITGNITASGTATIGGTMTVGSGLTNQVSIVGKAAGLVPTIFATGADGLFINAGTGQLTITAGTSNIRLTSPFITTQPVTINSTQFTVNAGVRTLSGSTLTPPFAVAATLAGTHTGTTHVQPYTFTIGPDTLDTGTTFVDGFSILDTVSAGAKGNRKALNVTFGVNGPITGDISAQQYVGALFSTSGSGNVGGTDPSTGSAGDLYGGNFVAILQPGATNWNLLNAMGEVDIALVGPTQTAQISGSPGAGDIVSLTFTSAGITGSPVTISHTIQAGETVHMIQNTLINLISQNANLVAAKISGSTTLGGGAKPINIVWPTALSVTITSSASGATTLTLGTAQNLGASVAQKFGMSVVRLSNDSIRGSGGRSGSTFGDSGIIFGTQSSTVAGAWDDIITVRPTALSPDGSLIRVTPAIAGGVLAPPPLLTWGLNLAAVDFADQSGFALLTPGWSVSGLGTMSVGNGQISYAAGGTTFDTTGFVGSGNATVASGGGSGGGDIGNNYVGDLIYDALGGQHVITSVNYQTGAAVTVRTVVQPFSRAGSSPATSQVTSGGSAGAGSTPTLNINWVASNTLALQTSGGPTTVGGSLAVTGILTGTTAAIDTNTTQAATTAFVLAQAASAAPLIDGAATVGTSTRYARADHVHPTDTTRAALTGGTFTGQVNVGNSTTAQVLQMNGAAGSGRAIAFSTAASKRWQLNANATAESGANAGTDFAIQAFDDTGTILTTPLTITRSTGLFNFATAFKFTGSQIVANGAIATTVTSLGPTGSHTTIQEWLTIVNSGGVTRYIPLY